MQWNLLNRTLENEDTCVIRTLSNDSHLCIRNWPQLYWLLRYPDFPNQFSCKEILYCIGSTFWFYKPYSNTFQSLWNQLSSSTVGTKVNNQQASGPQPITHLDYVYLQLPLFLFWSVHINHMQVHFQVCPVCAEVNYLMHCRVQEMITYWMIIYV